MLKIVAICSVLLPLVAFGQFGKAEDQNAIRALVDRFMEAWNLHDAHALAAVFSEDADFTNWRGTGASGRSRIEETHTPMFATVFKNSHQRYSDIKTRDLPSAPAFPPAVPEIRELPPQAKPGVNGAYPG